MTIRSGWKKSLTALPSRRNSGFDTTVASVSESSRRAWKWATEPTGTVDFNATTAPGRRAVECAECIRHGGPIGRTIVGRRRGQGDENNGSIGNGVAVAVVEREKSVRHAVRNQPVKSGFVEGHIAALDLLDSTQIRLADTNPVSTRSKPSGRNEANVASTNYSNLH